MKVIDLLNKIANGEEVPKKIKYSSYIFKYTGDKRIQRLYVMENQDNYLLRDFVVTLDSKIEILEEEHKIPEKLEFGRSIENGEEILTVPSEKMIIIKINEIIDYLEEIE